MFKKNTFKDTLLESSDIEACFEREASDETDSRLHQFQKLMAYYRCAIMEVATKFNVLNEEFSLQYDRNPISGIKSRLKQLSSMKEKLKKKGQPFTIEAIEEHLNDVAGVRVICSFPDDVYMLAEALLKQDDVILISRKDYIENPKPNGYRSLHLIVNVPIFLAHEKRIMKVEIQLRTIAMDFWASLEHQLRYKKDTEFTDEMARELQCCAQLSAELDARMDALREMVQLDSRCRTDQF
ncbi:MAG: GTP pyrophosphokinase family protein [Ruminococcus sp.]|nr:GTP pyrophosphokinase family protein [Ruminococcus sp.]